MHLAALAVGVVLSLVVPWQLPTPSRVSLVLGWPLAAAGIVLVGFAVGAAGRRDLAVPEDVVATGPYALSRNPMYLGWHLMYAGVGVGLRAAWLLVLLPMVLGLTQLMILREERGPERRLGEPYSRYRARVRRYL